MWAPRVVLDANVLTAAAFGGTPLDAVARAFAAGEVCVSPQIDAEIMATVARLERKLGGERSEAILALGERLRTRCDLAEEVPAVSICRDPKDDAYLALCVAAGADFLVTGDRDLLEIERAAAPELPKALRIVTPRQFLETTGALC